ncbi:MAG: hypothetical protein JSS20_21240 [Proteobacteria bacterium]|nr:hypothetical protein [Pseudomonadota bacterium]
MAEFDDRHDKTPGDDAPPGVRVAGLGALALVLLGAAYLIWVRGEAIVVDLSSLAAKVFCF